MKRIMIATCMLFSCLCNADPITLPDKPAEDDSLVVIARGDNKVATIDLDNMRYDKQHNIVEFLEVIIDSKTKQMISSKMAFACWDHKSSNPMITIVDMQTKKVIQQEKFDSGFKPIPVDSWLAGEYKLVCPKVKDPRATDL